ncbi:MAG: Na(+)-translocating NADH-quinone reductase subunit A [Chlamydiae bacterium]|nr:Na(+)-translocating NADH-quinone reductase subunit A [Chlamydiota bacterium]
MEIRIKDGLDIPLGGVPEGALKTFALSKRVALDLSPFEALRFTLLKKEGERVEGGEPLVEDKSVPGRFFVSPASGTISEVVRGLKRRILSIVIETDREQKVVEHEPLAVQSDPSVIMARLKEGGLLPHIRMLPCDRLAHPDHLPDVIFVKALESAPFAPPSELQVEGREEEFSAGLEVLARFCPVHLIYKKGCTFPPFINAASVERHSGAGPHPIANPSVHIAALHPILKRDQVVWSLDVSDVAAVGKLITKGVYETTRVISVAGEGMEEERRGFFRVNRGTNILDLVGGREGVRYISGDPLMGVKVEPNGFLGFTHQILCALPEGGEKRELFHFLRVSRKGYSATKAYLTRGKSPQFTTLQHGEERAFVDSSIYDRVMPLPIHTLPLIKALLAEDFERAEKLGLLEVSPEDFALPAFLCPSKIEMVEIIQRGQRGYSAQYYE